MTIDFSLFIINNVHIHIINDTIRKVARAAFIFYLGAGGVLNMSIQHPGVFNFIKTITQKNLETIDDRSITLKEIIGEILIATIACLLIRYFLSRIVLMALRLSETIIDKL